MRKSLRDVDTKLYWNKRWDAFELDEEEFHNMNIYPIKYVDPVMKEGTATLDAGCGLGRIVKHYNKKGFNIIGFDYSKIAVDKLTKTNPEVDIIEANISCLPYENEQFDNILALGVFHSIEALDNVEKGISEANRCLQTGGHLVAAVRADSLENRLIDIVTERRGKRGNCFHKWCFTRKEFQTLLERNGLIVDKIELVTNVPFFHKFKKLKKDRKANEGFLRSTGFRLNFVGNFIYKIVKLFFTDSFGTTLVFLAYKK